MDVLLFACAMYFICCFLWGWDKVRLDIIRLLGLLIIFCYLLVVVGEVAKVFGF